MTMQNSGAITMAQIRDELGLGNPVDLNNTRVRRVCQAGATGAVQMYNAYGQNEFLNEVMYIGQYTKYVTGTSTTVTGVNYGVYSSLSAKIVIAICVQNSVAEQVISSVTVNGTGTTLYTHGSGDNSNIPGLTWAVGQMPSGAYGDVNISFAGNIATLKRVIVTVWQVEGKTSLSTLTGNMTSITSNLAYYTDSAYNLHMPSGQTGLTCIIAASYGYAQDLRISRSGVEYIDLKDKTTNGGNPQAVWDPQPYVRVQGNVFVNDSAAAATIIYGGGDYPLAGVGGGDSIFPGYSEPYPGNYAYQRVFILTLYNNPAI